MWFGGEKAIDLEKYSDKAVEKACMKALRDCEGTWTFSNITTFLHKMFL